MRVEKMYYQNEEYNSVIVCPYCEERYEPSEETHIGHKLVNFHTENRQEFVCDKCGKKFAMYGFQDGEEWEIYTKTIDGQMEIWEAVGTPQKSEVFNASRRQN